MEQVQTNWYNAGMVAEARKLAEEKLTSVKGLITDAELENLIQYVMLEIAQDMWPPDAVEVLSSQVLGYSENRPG